MTTNTFRVPDISCQHCINAITKEVQALPDIQRVQIDLTEKTVTIDHGPQVSEHLLIAAINEAGYDQVAYLG